MSDLHEQSRKVVAGFLTPTMAANPDFVTFAESLYRIGFHDGKMQGMARSMEIFSESRLTIAVPTDGRDC